MAKFLITYHGMPHVDPAQMEQAREAFGTWLQEAGHAVVDPGAPTNAVAHVASGPPVSVEIGGYSIVEASSAAEVVKLLETHPFVARGGTLQVNAPIAT
jgi:hypothetical protein